MKLQVSDTIKKLHNNPVEKSLGEIQSEVGETPLVPLAWGENGWGPSPKVVRALRGELLQVQRYPDKSLDTLKRSIADKHGVSPEEIVVGAGSGQVVELLVRAFVQKGDEVISSSSTSYLQYDHVVTLQGGVSLQVPLLNFQHDLDSIRQIIGPATRIIFIDNPGSITGSALSGEDIYQFLSDVNESVLVVFDEAFIDYTDESLKVDIYSLIRNTKKRCGVIFLRSFSTLYGLAGLRVGYGIMDASVAAILRKIRIPYSVNRMAVAGAIAALEDDSYYADVVEKTCRERAKLSEEMKQRNCTVLQGHGNFLMIDTGINADLLVSSMVECGVVIRSLTHYDFPGCIRVTIGKEEENRAFLSCFDRCRSGIPHV